MSYVAQKNVHVSDFIEADRRNGNTVVHNNERNAYLKALREFPQSSTALEVGVGAVGRFFPFLRELFPLAEGCEPNENYALSFLKSFGGDARIYVSTIAKIQPHSKRWDVIVVPYTTICMFPKEHQREFVSSILRRNSGVAIFDTILTNKKEGQKGRQKKQGMRGKKFLIEYFMRPKSWFIETGRRHGFSVAFVHYIFSWRRLFGVPLFPKSIHTLVVMKQK